MTSPWLSTTEAATYLRVNRKTVERMLIELNENPETVPNKLRYRLFGEHKRVRIVRADVLAMLPEPELERTEA